MIKLNTCKTKIYLKGEKMNNLTKIFCIALLLIPAFAAASVTVTFTPTDDAYVDEGSATTNYGDSDTLSVQGTYSGGYPDEDLPSSVTETYLQFDISSLLSSLPSGAVIESVVFGIYLYDTADDCSEPSIDLYYAEDDWDEDTLTWDLAQDVDEVGDSLGTQASLGVTGYYEWDLLNNSEITWENVDIWSDGIVSFLLASTNDDEYNGAYFYSSEYSEGAYTPYLKITYSVVPEPASITLAALGLSSLMAVRRKKRGL